jgi:hypothetical protein
MEAQKASYETDGGKKSLLTRVVGALGELTSRRALFGPPKPKPPMPIMGIKLDDDPRPIDPEIFAAHPDSWRILEERLQEWYPNDSNPVGTLLRRVEQMELEERSAN